MQVKLTIFVCNVRAVGAVYQVGHTETPRAAASDVVAVQPEN